MPKVNTARCNKLRGYAKEYKVFSTDGDVLHCDICDKNVIADRRSQVKQHMDTKQHMLAISHKSASSSSDTARTPLMSNFITPQA